MRKSLTAVALLSTCSLFALDTKPWFGNVYEFEFQSAFLYQRFNQVQGASRQLSAPLNNRDYLLDLGVTVASAFDVQTELEFGQTNNIHWNFRSAALQGRYLALNDIAGDPVSLAFGLNLRGVLHHFLTDVSTPYASVFNIELTCALGKEWSSNGVWTMRTYGFGSIGQANRGYPWTRGIYVWQYNLYDQHRFTFFADSYVGFGNKQHVNVRHFNGWGKYQHQSVDLGVAYGYKIGVYGVITASYARRVYAHTYPENANTFMLAYNVPFSVI